ncbi:MAG: RNA chaperone Hfq [Piscirickettsiaceae bacterium]|nr:RNA chaperone Hfq [Piscirickettsiaceae bacterium]
MSENTLKLPGAASKLAKRQIRPKSKQKLVGHDILLDSALRNGKVIRLVKMSDGTEAVGNITNFDKFTITIDSPEGIMCFYKHAIESFLVKS